MTTIHVMSQALANKIAAGEVVERPSSVVKELVENAIDAGSDVITVEVEEGGIAGIRVADNGSGMSRQDSQLAFERHATSKLKNERELFRITTLGFRGEALPSISAVAKLKVQTWDGIEPVGTKLWLEGGHIKKIEDAPLRQGTVIEVTDLFYNTPARYKYLKGVQTELGHISDWMNRIALAHRHISFRLIHNGRTLFFTSGNGQMLAIAASIYGQKVARHMIPIQAEHLDFELTGLISKPELTRANRHFMTVIINGRYVRHPGIQQTVLKAYHTLLPLNRYPIAILDLSMDPSLVDVNVHPAKLEIRLSKEKELLQWLESEIKDVFRKHSLIPVPTMRHPGRGSGDQVDQQTLSLTLPKDIVHDQQAGYKPRGHERGGSSSHTPSFNPMPPKMDHNKEEAKKKDTDPGSRDASPTKDKSSDESVERMPLLHPLGQLHGTYILAQNEDGLYMIDQHAAQERVWYEYYREKLMQPEPASQDLAVPLLLEFTPGEAALIRHRKSMLEKLGLFLEEFGQHAYIVRAYPIWFPEHDVESAIRETITSVTAKQFEEHVFMENMAKGLACQQAIKANRYLNLSEMEALLEQLRQTSNPFTCPHGRPITVLISKYEIEKMFKRVM